MIVPKCYIGPIQKPVICRDGKYVCDDSKAYFADPQDEDPCRILIESI